MTDFSHPTPTPEAVAATPIPDASTTSTLAMSDPVLFFGPEWLNVSGPILDLLLLAAWQGAMIAAVAAIALAFLRHARPIWRYATAVTALVLLTVVPVFTWTLTPAPRADAQAPPSPAAAPVAPVPPAVQVPEFAPPPAAAPAPVSQAPASTLAETLWSGWSQLVDAAVPGPVAGAAASMRAWGEQTAPGWVAVWLAGVAFSMIKVAGGLWWIRSVRRSATPLPKPLRPLVVAAAHQAGTRTTISVKQSRRVDVPLVSGWLSPVVLLPSRLIEQAPKEEVEALLVHEFTHIRRHDVPVGWLQTLTEALLFFHPAAWWISRQVRREREHGTDDRVTNVGVSPVTYAHALTRVAELVVDRRPVPRGTLAPAASDGELLHRIRRMVTGTPEPVRRGSLFFATFALLAVPVLFTACSSGEKAAEAPEKVSAPAPSAPAPPSAPEAPSTSSNMVITRSHDGDTTRVKTFRLETNDGESVRVQRVRIQGDSVWLNDSLVVDSTWSAAFDSSFTYRLEVGDFLTDVDTAAFNASMRDLRSGLDRLPETLQNLNSDSTRAMFGFHAWALDSLRVSVDSLMGLRLEPDSLAAKIERGLQSRDSLHILLPRLDDSFPKGLRPNVYRFEMETKDRLRVLPDSARTPEAMMREAERLRREAERMEERAREMEEESSSQREEAEEEMREQREEMERRRQEMMEQQRDSLRSF